MGGGGGGGGGGEQPRPPETKQPHVQASKHFFQHTHVTNIMGLHKLSRGPVYAKIHSVHTVNCRY